MTATLRIDLSILSRRMRELREDYQDEIQKFADAGHVYDVSYREHLQAELRYERHLWQPKPTRTADQLRDELWVAAQNAYTAGATQKQIDLIVKLAEESGDLSAMGYGRLTKHEASRIIDQMKRENGR